MRALKPLILFGVGGLLYIAIEILWRGYSHWTMFFVGGICFALIGLVNEIFTFEMPMVEQMAISSIIITAIEFASGCIINLLLKWNVWNYSDLPFNILGQICLPYTALWFLVSAVGIILDDYLRYFLFGEERPHYKII